MALSLTACNDKETNKNEHKTTNADEQQGTKSNSESSDKTTDKHRENIDNVNEISEKTKLALAFFADDSGKYILTKDEALTGVYESKTGGKSQNKQLYKLLLINTKGITNAPKDMKFYTVYPSKGSFASIIGISKDKVYVGGTQAALDYNELLKTGNEYSIKELYNKNKSYSSLTELAHKLQFADKNPMENEKTRQEFEANENPNTNSHMRTQVYQMIEELDGHPIDRDKYLIDNVKNNKNGKWYVNYRNKNAEIVGTYTTKGEKVIKKDVNGNIIKSKKIDPNKYY